MVAALRALAASPGLEPASRVGQARRGTSSTRNKDYKLSESSRTGKSDDNPITKNARARTAAAVARIAARHGRANPVRTRIATPEELAALRRRPAPNRHLADPRACADRASRE
jgi:hypothetical protein